MKKYIFILLNFLFIFNSCEDVIELELENQEKRLVIEANLLTNTQYQFINITLSAPFFDQQYTIVKSAIASVKDLNTQEVYTFEYDGIIKRYRNVNFTPQIGGNYQLSVTYNNELYEGEITVLKSPSDISVVQKINERSEDEYELEFSFQDPEDEKNYYATRFSFDETSSSIYDLEIRDDTFINGNMYKDREIVSIEDTGLKVKYTVTEINESVYYYLNKIRSSVADIGNPFAVPIGRIKGNIENKTNKENYPLGFFNISAPSIFEYVIE